MADSRMVKSSHFTSLWSTPPCLDGSRAWRQSFANVACGRQMACSHNVQISVALQEELTAAVGSFFLCSLISRIRSLFCKSISSTVVTFVIFTLNIIASLILLSNTGELQSFNFGWPGVWGQLKRWNRRSSPVSMISLCFKSSGESLAVIFYSFPDVT